VSKNLVLACSEIAVFRAPDGDVGSFLCSDSKDYERLLLEWLNSDKDTATATVTLQTNCVGDKVMAVERDQAFVTNGVIGQQCTKVDGISFCYDPYVRCQHGRRGVYDQDQDPHISKAERIFWSTNAQMFKQN